MDGSSVLAGFRFASFNGECAAHGNPIHAYITLAGSRALVTSAGVIPLTGMDDLLSSSLTATHSFITSPVWDWCHAHRGQRLVLHADVRGGHRFASNPLACP